jgi:hypothetical protein
MGGITLQGIFCPNVCFTTQDLNAKYYLDMVLNLKFIAIFLLKCDRAKIDWNWLLLT